MCARFFAHPHFFTRCANVQAPKLTLEHVYIDFFLPSRSFDSYSIMGDKLEQMIAELGSRQNRVPEINAYCADQYKRNPANGFSKAKGYSSGK